MSLYYEKEIKEIIVWKEGNVRVEAKLYDPLNGSVLDSGGRRIVLDPKNFSSLSRYKFLEVIPTRMNEQDEDELCKTLGGSMRFFNAPFGLLEVPIPDDSDVFED